MARNQGLRSHSAHALGSSGPTVVCPFFPRHFRTRGRRTKHIRAHHPGEPYIPNSPVPPPPIPCSSSLPPQPIPSNNPPRSPFPDYLLPAFLRSVEIAALYSDAEDDLDSVPDMDDPQVREIFLDGFTRLYHSKLDGKVEFVCGYAPTLRLHVGRICDEGGNSIPLDTPLPPRCSDKGLDDWTPFNSGADFELADYLFRDSQMSARQINILLDILAAFADVRDEEPPFSTATQLYNTIDMIPLGEVRWESFVLQYDGHRPAENIPPWMEAQYDVWFRDPRTLIYNLLSNPEFNFGFDYKPYQERTTDEVHRFRDFMSGDWAWNQAVGLQ